MNVWLVILLGGAVTFATRASFIFLIDRLNLPGWFWRALRFVPVAVLSAIILPETVTRNGTTDVSLTNPQVIAALLAVAVAWRTRNVLLTLVAGMLGLLASQALFAL